MPPCAAAAAYAAAVCALPPLHTQGVDARHDAACQAAAQCEAALKAYLVQVRRQLGGGDRINYVVAANKDRLLEVPDSCTVRAGFGAYAATWVRMSAQSHRSLRRTTALCAGALCARAAMWVACSHVGCMSAHPRQVPVVMDMRQIPVVMDAHQVPDVMDMRQVPGVMDMRQVLVAMDKHQVPVVMDMRQVPVVMDMSVLDRKEGHCATRLMQRCGGGGPTRGRLCPCSAACIHQHVPLMTHARPQITREFTLDAGGKKGFKRYTTEPLVRLSGELRDAEEEREAALGVVLQVRGRVRRVCVVNAGKGRGGEEREGGTCMKDEGGLVRCGGLVRWRPCAVGACFSGGLAWVVSGQLPVTGMPTE